MRSLSTHHHVVCVCALSIRVRFMPTILDGSLLLQWQSVPSWEFDDAVVLLRILEWTSEVDSGIGG